jgi:hypothetical protein
MQQLSNDNKTALTEVSSMQKTLGDVRKENNEISANIMREQAGRDKVEISLKNKINELEEKLIHEGIKLRGSNLDAKQSKTIRDLQEDLATSR